MLQGLGSVSQYGWPSGLAERAWTALLSDPSFLDTWIATNSQRLGENYRRATAILDSHDIDCHSKGFRPPRPPPSFRWGKANAQRRTAALFLWVDLSPFLPEGYVGVAAERELGRRLLDAGVFMPAGEEFCAETVGHFRIVFSMPWDWVQEGLTRMLAVCGVL